MDGVIYGLVFGIPVVCFVVTLLSACKDEDSLIYASPDKDWPEQTKERLVIKS